MDLAPAIALSDVPKVTHAPLTIQSVESAQLEISQMLMEEEKRLDADAIFRQHVLSLPEVDNQPCMLTQLYFLVSVLFWGLKFFPVRSRFHAQNPYQTEIHASIALMRTKYSLSSGMLLE